MLITYYKDKSFVLFECIRSQPLERCCSSWHETVINDDESGDDYVQTNCGDENAFFFSNFLPNNQCLIFRN